MRRRLLLMLLLVLLPAGSLSPADGAGPPLPRSVAALGDSITQAVDVCCWYGNHPGSSWSTGGSRWDGVTSHYERLRALEPEIAGHNHNDAVSGARMSAGPTQAREAVVEQAEYVTILLGANDLCTSSPGTMTPVDTFRSQFRETLRILVDGLPQGASIFVASIPDVYRLWQLYHTDPTATLVWEVADICQSLLSLNRTEAERQQVRERNQAFNDVLREECVQHTRCRFDGYAVFEFQFGRSDVSKLDYFHPSLSGQARLAEVTWSTSWWS